MAPTEGTPLPRIAIKGKEIGDKFFDSLVDCRVSRELGAPGTAAVRFYDPEFDLFSGGFIKIADSLSISFVNPAGKYEKIFTGTVGGVGVEQGVSDLHHLVVTGYDSAQGMNRQSSPMAYQNTTVSEVVSQIAKRNGLTANLKLPQIKLEYFLQTEDDHATLDMILARVGASWWVEEKKLFAQPQKVASPMTLIWRESLTKFSARYSGASRTDSVTVRGWDPSTQKAISGVSQRSSTNGQKLGASIPMFDKRSKEAKAMKGKAVVTDAPVETAKEAKALADSLQGDVAINEIIVSGEAQGQPSLAVGKTVELKNLGPQLSGKIFITRVDHRYAVGKTLLTQFEGGQANAAGLANRFVNSQRGIDRSLRQLAIGTVTNVKDPDKTGRVKLKVPSISDKDETAWARVVSLGAGPGRGAQFTPEVGDEVLVAFIGGDQRFPMVVGGLWSKKNAPPIPSPASKDDVDKRSIMFGSGSNLTASADDKKKKAVFKLEHADPANFLALAENGIEIQAQPKGKLLLKVGKASIEMDGNGDISIKGVNIKISGSKAITVDGQNLTVKGKMGALVDGGGSKLDLKKPSANLSSSGITGIKGSMVKLN
jgi:uncharacterized protein involved in type VI secretion and phage assembly